MFRVSIVQMVCFLIAIFCLYQMTASFNFKQCCHIQMGNITAMDGYTFYGKSGTIEWVKII